MAKVWKEQLDGSRHQNKMDAPVDRRPNVSFVPKWVFFVRVCSFTFEFHSLKQIGECLEYYSQKIHPTSRIPWKELPLYGGDQSETQRWYERLPMYLLEEPKRQKVVKALSAAIEQFEAEGFKR
jgi:hypothetical protein